MRDNPIRDFREKRLGWSRAQLGERLRRSDKLVAVYEAEAGDDLLRELARLASETGHLDYEKLFLTLAGDDAALTNDASDPYAPSTSEERYLVRGLLEIIRNPDPDSHFQASIPQLLREILAHRERFYKRR